MYVIWTLPISPSCRPTLVENVNVAIYGQWKKKVDQYWWFNSFLFFLPLPQKWTISRHSAIISSLAKKKRHIWKETDEQRLYYFLRVRKFRKGNSFNHNICKIRVWSLCLLLWTSEDSIKSTPQSKEYNDELLLAFISVNGPFQDPLLGELARIKTGISFTKYLAYIGITSTRNRVVKEIKWSGRRWRIDANRRGKHIDNHMDE